MVLDFTLSNLDILQPISFLIEENQDAIQIELPGVPFNASESYSNETYITETNTTCNFSSLAHLFFHTMGFRLFHFNLNFVYSFVCFVLFCFVLFCFVLFCFALFCFGMIHGDQT